MPIATNLNIHPYYDDHDETKDYYKVLFQPGVSVQVRELNQLQTLFQQQIERFGDNIFKKGTIITGCNFTFYNNYPYIKINDNDIYNVPTVPSLYVSKFVKNQSNLTAHVLNSYDGSETASPDLKTLYIKYINSGNTGNVHFFSPGDTLTVYDADNSIFDVVVNNGGLGFSNTDQIVFTSVITVQMQSGSNFSVGDFVNNGLQANVEVLDVDTTTLASNNLVLIKYKPLLSDLANNVVDPNKWLFSISDNIFNASNTSVGKVHDVYGFGATAEVVTDASGIIQYVLISSGGEGYTVAPYASVISRDNTTGINIANLEVKNFLTKILVNGSSDATGSGYAFHVSEGVIYQKGYFLRVPQQTVIVDKYSNQPNNVVAGFKTVEYIVTYNEDDSLFDNINGDNKNAPGADRLRLEPVLYITSSTEAAANVEFFDLVEWNEGLPYKQNQLTQYSHIGDEMAQRTFDQSGNFIIDTFQVATKYTANTTDEGKYYSVIVDPGQAYIHGYKVQTLRNFVVDMRKGLSTQTGNNNISLNYGNYIKVNEVVGTFPFATAEKVELWSFPAAYISTNSKYIIPRGGKIGTARIRSLIHEDGVPGTNTATYSLYLFDIRMSKGYSFESVASVAYYDDASSTYLGICDTIRTSTVVYPTGNRTVYVSDSATAIVNTNIISYDSATAKTNTAVNTSVLFFGDTSLLYANLAFSNSSNLSIVNTGKPTVIQTVINSTAVLLTSNQTILANGSVTLNYNPKKTLLFSNTDAFYSGLTFSNSSSLSVVNTAAPTIVKKLTGLTYTLTATVDVTVNTSTLFFSNTFLLYADAAFSNSATSNQSVVNTSTSVSILTVINSTAVSLTTNAAVANGTSNISFTARGVALTVNDAIVSNGTVTLNYNTRPVLYPIDPYVKLVTKIFDTNKSKLLFDSGSESIKNSSATRYQYRTLDTTTYFSNTVQAQLFKTIAATNETYPYGFNAELSTSDLRELYVVPTNNHIYQADVYAGELYSDGTEVLTGDANTNFYDNFVSGDFITINPDGFSNVILRVVSITSPNSMIVSEKVVSNTTGMDHSRVFPQYIPIPFGSRDGLSANTNSTGKTLTLYLKHSNGQSFAMYGMGQVATSLGVNIERNNVTSNPKTATRKKYVKICVGNNNTGGTSSNTAGPWCIGVPDVFRLRNVYVGSNSSVNTSSKSAITDFYIDHNQNANYLDLGWLYKKPKSGVRLNNSSWLLVEFDYFAGGDAGGYFDTVSYLNTSNATQLAINESLSLSELTANTNFCNSWEIPEVYTYDGKYYDLLNTFDFRPTVSATCTPSDTDGSAPVNPSAQLDFSNTDKKFPVPDTRMSTTIEQYLGRVDSVFISGDDTGHIYVIEGISAADPRKRLAANYPKTSLKIQEISVPPYPNVSQNLSGNLNELLRTNIVNEKSLNLRLKSHVIQPIYSTLDMQLSQPMVYTMEDIATLERRIADLEYYQSLSILETSITNKIIPSSIDSTMNRFKFGFFADDFSTTNYSDLENPQYAASIEQDGDEYYGISKDPLTPDDTWANSDKTSPQSKILSPGKLVKKVTNRVVPPKQLISINHITENVGFIDYDIIDQLNATDSPPPCEIKIPIINTVCNACIHHIYYFGRNEEREREDEDDNGRRETNEIFELHFKLPSFPHTVGLYTDHGLTGTAIEIWQGANKLVKKSKRVHPGDKDDVEDWDDDDKIRLKRCSPIWFRPYHDHDSDGNKKHEKEDDDDHFRGCGRIRWNHNPSDGDDYKVKCRCKGHFKFIIEYKCSNVITGWTTQPCINIPPPSFYKGTLGVSNTGGGAWSCSKVFVINGINTTFLNLYATGMKPSTNHYFYIDGVDETRNTIQYTMTNPLPSNITVNVTKSIVTDANGKCWFRLFFQNKLPGFASTNGGKNMSANWLAIIYTAIQNKQSYGSSGYSLFELKNSNDSYASLMVPRRKPGITFSATNPRGYP